MEQFTNFLFDEWPLTLALIFIIILIGRSFLEPLLSSIKSIKPQDAVRLMNDNETTVLDVRLEKEFKVNEYITLKLKKKINYLR